MSCGMDEDTYHESIEHYDFRTNTWTLLADPVTSSVGQQTMSSDEVKQIWEMVTGQVAGGNGSNTVLSTQIQAALLAGEEVFLENEINDAEGEEEEEGEDQDQGSLQFEEFSVKSFEEEEEEGDEEGNGPQTTSSEGHSEGFVTLRKSFLGRSCHTMMRIL